MIDGQAITKATYEDPATVEGYIQLNALNPKQAALLTKFTKTFSGKKVLDLGCGPGQYAYLLAEQGYEVTALDYSEEMINRAKTFKASSNPPAFIVGDMRQLSSYFEPNTFDAIWANASLLHIPSNEIDQVLSGITTIAKPNAKVCVSLKGGAGTTMIEDTKLGKVTYREFTLWTPETFTAVTQSHHWQLDWENHRQSESLFQGKPTTWLDFFFSINK